MRLRFIKKYKLCLIVIVCIISVINNAHGFVHCKSEDGHSDIEFIGNACCDAVNTDISPENTTTFYKEIFLTSSDNCGPCVDTLISTKFIKALKKNNPVKSSITVLPVVLTSTTRSYGSSGYQPSSELLASVNPCLACLRTIILLA
jgi:hypothetical protein